MSLPDSYHADIDLTEVLRFILAWIDRLYYFLRHTYIIVFSYRFSLWDFTIGAMIIAGVIAALLPDHRFGFDDDVVGEFYDDGYFDDERNQL